MQLRVLLVISVVYTIECNTLIEQNVRVQAEEGSNFGQKSLEPTEYNRRLVVGKTTRTMQEKKVVKTKEAKQVVSKPVKRTTTVRPVTTTPARTTQATPVDEDFTDDDTFETISEIIYDDDKHFEDWDDESLR